MIDAIDRFLSAFISDNNPEPERSKALFWSWMGLPLAILGFLVGFILMWPVAQAYAPWLPRGSWRPAGLGVHWQRETIEYLFFGVIEYFWDWVPVLWDRFFDRPSTLTGLPAPEMILPVGGMLGMLVWWSRLSPYEMRYKSQGSAKWATMADLKADQLFCETGMILGRAPLAASSTPKASGRGRKQSHFIRNWEMLSGILISPPGTGKTVQLVTMILADWPDRIRGWKTFRPFGWLKLGFLKKIKAGFAWTTCCASGIASAVLLSLPPQILGHGVAPSAAFWIAACGLMPVSIVLLGAIRLPYLYGWKRASLPGPSMVINDPKGEIFDTTSKWRATLGPVKRLAWAELSGDSWNPLDPGNFPGGNEILAIRSEIVSKLKPIFGEYAPVALCGILQTMESRSEGWLEYLVQNPRRVLESDPDGLKEARIDAGTGAVIESLYPLLMKLAKIYSERETFIDGNCTILLPNTIELHWRITGREALAGFIGLVYSRWERDPQTYGAPSFAKVLDWLNGMAKSGDGFSDLKVTVPVTGEDGEHVPGAVSAPEGVGSEEDPLGGDADEDLTQKLLDEALDECVRYGYPSRVYKDLKALRLKPDRERGSVISTAAGSINIFKNAAVRSRTSSSTISASDLRGIPNGRGGVDPVTVYIVVPLKDAPSLGRVTALFLESSAKYLLSEDSAEFDKKKASWMTRPVLILAEEFWTLEAMESLRQIPALGRGLWAAILIVGQSFSQISSKYGSDGRNVLQELDNSTHYKIMPAQNDTDSAERVSKMLGNRTVISTNKSYDGAVKLGARVSTSLQSMPLIRSDELMRLEKMDPKKNKYGWQLVRFGQHAIMCRPSCWFDVPELEARKGRMSNDNAAGPVLPKPHATEAAAAAPAGRLSRQVAKIGERAAVLAFAILAAAAAVWGGEAQAQVSRTQAGCLPAEDFLDGAAYQSFRKIEDIGNGRSLIGDCVPSYDNPFRFTPEKSCPVMVEPARGQALEQTRLVYVDDRGRRHQASDCAPRPNDSGIGKTRVLPLTYVSHGCPLTHDWARGISTAETRRIFVMDGEEYEVEACALRASPPVLRHERQACSALTTKSGLKIEQARIDVVEGSKRWTILPCQPDLQRHANLKATPAGCEGRFHDDLQNRISFGSWRYYLETTGPDGSPSVQEFIGDCVANPHAMYGQSDELVGYKPEDPRLISWLVMQRRMIGEGGVAARLVRGPQVTRYYQAYSPGDIRPRETGRYEAAACVRFHEVEERQAMIRPDNTAMEVRRRSLAPRVENNCPR